MTESHDGSSGSSLAVTNVRVYATPDAPPLDRATVLIRGGRIVAAGTQVEVPPGTEVIPGEGRVVTAGFWNAHVHFTEPKWRLAARESREILEANLHDMLTSRGFTTVVDVGSDPRRTMALRRRIESGELLGPRIYTSGPGVYPPRGIPYYLKGSLPFWLRPFVPQPRTPASAARATERNIAHGADLVKLFTGSYVERGKVVTMPEPIARAAADVAHAHGRVVYSHPSNLEGSRVAVRCGVDVLAHPPDSTEGVDRSVLREMVDRRMAMIPTLKMFTDTVRARADYLDPIYEVVREFRALGGELLFGTDVGYMTDYTTEDEFQALTHAGVDARGILRMLTTAPVERLGLSKGVGSVTPGQRGDLVVLDADPIEDVSAFSRVRATVREGRVLSWRR
ncbi:MAG: amidohydrolase family protein [Thermoplasmata archaeon]